MHAGRSWDSTSLGSGWTRNEYLSLSFIFNPVLYFWNGKYRIRLKIFLKTASRNAKTLQTNVTFSSSVGNRIFNHFTKQPVSFDIVFQWWIVISGMILRWLRKKILVSYSAKIIARVLAVGMASPKPFSHGWNPNNRLYFIYKSHSLAGLVWIALLADSRRW